MSEELRPCPFCGGEARFHQYSAGARLAAAREGMPLVAMVECSRCGAMTSFDDGAMPTEDRARALWNRRAERTCRPVHTREKWECGACGCEIMPGFMPVFKGVGVLRYCPNCGAKVVGE